MDVLPSLIVFDLDACIWTPEMYELHTAPTAYDAAAGGVRAGRDTVKLFHGSATVLRRLLTDPRFASVKIAAASSTNEPQYAATCLAALPADSSGEREERVCDLIDFREIYPASKGQNHFPALHKASGVPYDGMLFFDDCGYVDNCADVVLHCPGVACVRTPHGLTEAAFDAALAAFADGARGILKMRPADERQLE